MSLKTRKTAPKNLLLFFPKSEWICWYMVDLAYGLDLYTIYTPLGAGKTLDLIYLLRNIVIKAFRLSNRFPNLRLQPPSHPQTQLSA